VGCLRAVPTLTAIRDPSDRGTAVTPENAEHLNEMQLVGMDIFANAVAELGDAAKPTDGLPADIAGRSLCARPPPRR
jgi:hypothetical protein